MRKSDLSSRRQKTAEMIPEHSGQWAVTPDKVPETIPHAGNEAIIALAGDALDRLGETLDKLAHKKQILSALDRLEAVASSQIEGTQTAVDELFYLEATGDAASLPADASVTQQYITATAEAFQRMADAGVNGFDHVLILGIHQKLMANSKHASSGYREVQNWIGGFKIQDARFIPPRPRHVHPLMSNLLTLMRYEPESVLVTSIIMRMAIVHAQFEMIHPFTDGNGRVGRILMRLMLVAENHFLPSFGQRAEEPGERVLRPPFSCPDA